LPQRSSLTTEIGAPLGTSDRLFAIEEMIGVLTPVQRLSGESAGTGILGEKSLQRIAQDRRYGAYRCGADCGGRRMGKLETTIGFSGGGSVEDIPVLAPEFSLAACDDAVVCVPARNEAGRLPKLIAALDRQGGRFGRPLRVMLLVNNSLDGSGRAAARAGAIAPHIELRIVERCFAAAVAHAGSARRAAMEAGADWLERDGVAGGVLLTTDADAVPDDDWVGASCAALEAGADVAAAAITGDPAEEAGFPPALRAAIGQVALARTLALDLEDAIDSTLGDPAPRHADHTGGGLALRLATYRAVGGCPALPFREDIGLVDAVRRMGGVVRHSPAVRVTVSARMQGRAAGGMAATIRAWSERIAQGGVLMAPDPAEQIYHWRARAAARAEAAHATAALPQEFRARIVAAELARRIPDPVDWHLEIPAHDAISMLKQYLDVHVRALSAA
jgi:hypothetical protein